MNTISFGRAKQSDALRVSVLLETVYVQTYDIEGITIESANYVNKTFSPERIEKLIKEMWLVLPKLFIIVFAPLEK